MQTEAKGQLEATHEAKETILPSTKKYPRSIFFIIGNEFCERLNQMNFIHRFCFYGMKAILPIYLTAWLAYSEDKSTTIIHSFNFACYFFTLFGN
jgi:dipeptide/tripeptide permease